MRTISLVYAISSLVLGLFSGISPLVYAAPPDFSSCDGLSGVAAGLCRAGAAANCSIDNTTSTCTTIAEQYTRITGEPAPWVEAQFPTQSTTLEFEVDSIDLETGEIGCVDDPIDCMDEEMLAPYDLHVSFNSLQTNPAVINYRRGCDSGEALISAQIAFLDGSAFGDVSVMSIDTATFVNDFIDEPLDTNDTIILLTCEGNYFKVGNIACNAGNPTKYPDCQDLTTPLFTVTVEYRRLE